MMHEEEASTKRVRLVGFGARDEVLPLVIGRRYGAPD
jgi:hypothetical protein